SLIQQQCLYVSLRSFQGLAKMIVAEVIGKRLRCKFRKFFSLKKLRCFDDIHESEMSLILKDKSISAVEFEDRTCEFWFADVRIEQQKTSAHPKVRYQCSSVIKVEKNRLTASVDEIDGRTG